MNISRWIYFPLIFVALYVLQGLILFGSITAGGTLFYAVLGAAFGFFALFWSNYKAKKVTGRSDDEDIHKVRQNRDVTLLLDYDRAFEVCREAVRALDPAKIREENPATGVIRLRTRMSWHTFGHVVTLKLAGLNENLTEVNISTEPIPRTLLVSSGYSWKAVEDLSRFIRERDAELNQRVLTSSAAILEDVYVNPFRKEKVER